MLKELTQRVIELSYLVKPKDKVRIEFQKLQLLLSTIEDHKKEIVLLKRDRARLSSKLALKELELDITV